MKIQPTALANVKRLNAALAVGDDARLMEAMESIGAEGLFDPEALDLARASGHVPLVILLATIWQANEVGDARIGDLLLAYQSFAEKSRRPALGGLLGITMVAILHDARLDEIVVGESDDWAEAVILALDLQRADVAGRLVQHFLTRRPDVAEAQRVFDRMATRHQAAIEDASAAALAKAYAAFGSYLRGRYRGDLRLFALYEASAWQRAGDARKAVRAAACVDGGPCFGMARLVAAKALGVAGDIAAAIGEFDSYLRAACDGVRAPQALLETAKPEKVFDTGGAARALADLMARLAPLGVEPFLISGTLLGYARHGDLLSHDKDIDLGLFGWERQFDIVEALRRDGCFVFDSRFLRGDQAWMLPLTHAATAVAIDLFFYRRQGEVSVTGIDSRWGYTELFAFRAFDLADVDFLGLKMKAPADVDAYLTDAFGSWRTPEPAYESTVESPAIVDKGGLQHMFAARIALANAVEEGRPATILRILDAMARYRHFPHALDAATEARLRALCAEAAALSVA